MKRFSAIVLLVFYVNAINSEIYDCKSPPAALRKLEDCCTFPSLIDESVLDECKTQHGVVTGKPKGDFKKMMCVYECAFNQTGLKPSGQVDMDKLTQDFSSKMNNDEALIEALNNAITTCANGKNRQSNSGKKQPKGGKNPCNGNDSQLYMCINRTIAKNCPTSLSSDDDGCQVTKEFYSQCPTAGQKKN